MTFISQFIQLTGLKEITENNLLSSWSRQLEVNVNRISPLHLFSLFAGAAAIAGVMIQTNFTEVYIFTPFCNEFCLGKVIYQLKIVKFVIGYNNE